MAMASPPANHDPPLGDPPDNTDGNSNPNARTIPEWMDFPGNFGQRIILSMSPSNNTKLPIPFIIGKSIESACGKIEAATTEDNCSKYILKTRSAEQAKKLMQMTRLTDGTEVTITTHPLLNVSRCVVSCREVINMTEEQLAAELKEQGVSKVRRITRPEGAVRINTPTLILTINGTVAPRYIWFGPLRVATRAYYPKPLICYKCFSYGHGESKCKGPTTCRQCSTSHSEEIEDCLPYCKNCRGSHSPLNRKCPQFMKEERIIKIKIDNGISFVEARKEYAKAHGEKSYANVCSAQERLEKMRKDIEKDNEIRILKNEIDKLKELNSDSHKDTIIMELRKELEEMRKITRDYYRIRSELDKTKKNEAQLRHVMEISDDEMECQGTKYTQQSTSTTTKQADPENINNTSDEDQKKTKRRKKERLRSPRTQSTESQMNNDDCTNESENETTDVQPSEETKQPFPKPKRGRPPKNR